MRRKRSPSLQELRVLAYMMQKPNSDYYGLEIINGTSISAGTLYPILARWEKQSWVTSDWEDIDEKVEGRRRRRYYHLTPDGIIRAKEVLNSQAKTFAKFGAIS